MHCGLVGRRVGPRFTLFPIQVLNEVDYMSTWSIFAVKIEDTLVSSFCGSQVAKVRLLKPWPLISHYLGIS